MYTRLRGHDNETGEPEIVVPAVFQKKLCGLFAPAVKNCNAQKMDSGLRRNDTGGGAGHPTSVTPAQAGVHG